MVGNYSVKDWQIDSSLGYSFPVGKKKGLVLGYLSLDIPSGGVQAFRISLSTRRGMSTPILISPESLPLAMCGFMVKVGKFDINANLLYCQKPARLIPGTTVANMKMLIGLENSPGWIRR